MRAEVTVEETGRAIACGHIRLFRPQSETAMSIRNACPSVLQAILMW
uniref:Uncharacterized protein n=1 Tax=Physcomitrium patens TaxID=3218 RepID=A0A2K1JY45_PHYPA|nr:hypothetical protein PHYPA_013564 [Physcomitrium patens]